MRKVAIYARVSTEHEAQLSALENQIQYYDEELAKHPDWELYDRYIDEGITGTSTKKRPNFMRMIKDAENGCFDLIITREVSRFARNTTELLESVRRLRELGIKVVFEKENIDAEFVGHPLISQMPIKAQRDIIFEKYGLLLKHLLLQNKVDSQRVVAYMRNENISINDAIEEYVLRRNCRNLDIDYEWVHELYGVITDENMTDEYVSVEHLFLAMLQNPNKEIKEIYFSIKDNGVKCETCKKLDKAAISMSMLTFTSLIYTLSSEPKKIFSFDIPLI